MEPGDLLSTIVEFSIGLAGFSGLVGIFIRRSGEWDHVDRFRITNLLLMSLTPGFMSFFTLGLLQSPAGLERAVETSAGVFAAVLAVLLVVIPRSRARVPERDKHLVGRQVFVPMSVAFVVMLLLQVLVAVSAIDAHEFLIYYYSLVAMLLLAVVQFARLILARPARSFDGASDDG